MPRLKNKSYNNNILIPTRINRPTPKVSIQNQKAFARYGMIGFLGTLFVSGFFKFKGAKTWHLYSGFSLLALSWWHHRLNQPKNRLKRRKSSLS